MDGLVEIAASPGQIGETKAFPIVCFLHMQALLKAFPVLSFLHMQANQWQLLKAIGVLEDDKAPSNRKGRNRALKVCGDCGIVPRW